MTYITGDTHGSSERIKQFCRVMETTKADTMIVLGDAGFNYYGGARDAKIKAKACTFPIRLFCIHGNHEIRPQNIPSYKETEFCGGHVLYEPEYPDLLFAIDGEVYELDGLQCIAIGGAYSVDKFYRLEKGYGWWPDEQPSPEIKAAVEQKLEAMNYRVDIILSHTCPRKYEPVETFLDFIDQSTVDKATEDWLDEIEAKTDYRKWYCGHYHTRKHIDRMQFMFEDFDVLSVRQKK
jgi:3-oxoacid CoA-transferase subunit A